MRYALKEVEESDVKLAEIYAVIDSMATSWPSTVVPRRSIPKFTGYLYSIKFMANRDSQKTGPEGAFTIGGQKCYPILSLTSWLKSLASVSWSKRKSIA